MVEPNEKVSGSTSVRCALVAFVNGSLLIWISVAACVVCVISMTAAAARPITYRLLDRISHPQERSVALGWALFEGRRAKGRWPTYGRTIISESTLVVRRARDKSVRSQETPCQNAYRRSGRASAVVLGEFGRASRLISSQKRVSAWA